MKLGILLLTYDREEYARRVLESLNEHLYVGTTGEVWLHIADDGSPDGYVERLLEHVRSLPLFRGVQVTASNVGRRGYGASYNAGTQVLHPWADVMLPLEDDWVLARRFDVPRYASPLLAGLIGCVRMGYLGYTQDLRGVLRAHDGTMYLLLDPDSPERHVSAGHPRLETVKWARKVGPWPEGIGPGETEFEWCGRRAARIGVAWPMDVRPTPGDLWAHIGTIQARSDQR